MTRNSFRMPLLCLAIVLIDSGCNRVPTAERARSEFEPIIERIKQRLERMEDGSRPYGGVTYELKDRTSVIAPVTAHVRFSHAMPVEFEFAEYSTIHAVSADYAYMNSKWVCDKISFKIIDVQSQDTQGVSDETRREFVGQKFDWEGETVRESETALVILLRDCT